MERFFIKLYRLFKAKKWLMWTSMCLTLAVFIFFGLQVKYEEDISKLLPQTDSATEAGLAFGNLKVKDKVFVQIRGKEDVLDTWTLASYMDEFVDSLLVRDASSGYISGILSSIGPDEMLMALDFVLTNLPTFVDTSAYAGFDELLTPQAIDAQMAVNADLVFNDETGSVSTMVGYDPANLRSVILGGLMGKSEDGSSGIGGFTLVDGQLFCADSTVALAFLSPDFNSMDSKAGTKLVKMMEKEIRAFEQAHPDAQVLFHGNAVQSVFNSRQIKKDLVMTVGLSLIVICIVIWSCFRSLSTLPLLLLPVIYGAFFALACVFWIKGGMSLMAIGIGALILGVALSYCLHVMTHSKYVDDTEQLLKDQVVPVFLGCITTIGAFAGLLLTKSELLRDFGIFASLAMVGTVFFALVYLPHFLDMGKKKRDDRAFAFIDKINNYPYDRKAWLLIPIVLICIVSLFTQKWVTFDSDLRNIGYNEPKVVESRDLYSEKNNSGLYSMYYASAAPTLDSALMQSRFVAKALSELQAGGIVSGYSGVSSLFLTELEQNNRIDAWKSYWSEARLGRVRGLVEASATKYGLDPSMFETFFVMAEADYEAASLYEAGVLPAELVSNFIEETPDGRFMVFTSALMQEADKEVVNDAVAACPGGVVIDPFYYTGNMVRILNDDFNVIIGVSTVFVFIVLLLSFRSLALALIAFLPMFFSWFVVKGFMGIFGLQFNLINIIVATFIFGIGVDYSIFVMKGLLSGASGEDKGLLTYHKAAIFFSAFVLIVVVVSLLFAAHPAISSIGVSTLVGMSSTILITYTLQPFCFRMLLRIPYFGRKFGAGSSSASGAASESGASGSSGTGSSSASEDAGGRHKSES